jgi:hypothetical protein
MNKRLEVIKGHSSEFLKSKRVFFVEISNLMLGIGNICCKFPRVEAFLVFLFDTVLQLIIEDI